MQQTHYPSYPYVIKVLSALSKSYKGIIRGMSMLLKYNTRYPNAENTLSTLSICQKSNIRVVHVL